MLCHRRGVRVSFNKGVAPGEIWSEFMDLIKMLAELRRERDQFDEAILTLERLAHGGGRRRGRPPAWMSDRKRRGRPPGSKNKAKKATSRRQRSL